MGARAAADSVSKILLAFLKQRTWAQSELATLLGLTVKATRAALQALEASGVPFEREVEHPHVYWSVPKTWFPTGAALERRQLEAVSRLVARLPRSAEREAAMRALLEAAPDLPRPLHAEEREPASASLALLEDTARERVAARIVYASASGGAKGPRDVSIHRFAYDGPVRFVATCHRAGALRWFRADRVEHVERAAGEPFRSAPSEEIGAFVAASFDGFHGSEPVGVHACFVREPEARWVTGNLPRAAEIEQVPGGVRIVWRVAALMPLARFVVGLGAAARPETAELREAVRELARGALTQGSA